MPRRHQRRSRLLLTLALLCLSSTTLLAQSKLLTLDDIYDPVKRVNFSGQPPLNLQWLKNGNFYLQSRKDRLTGTAQLFKVNAVTGEAAPFYDAAKMEAALARLPSVTADDAKKLAHLSAYQMNPAQTAALLNHKNNLVYYEFGTDAAAQITSGESEINNEDFSPDGRLVSFVRNNNLYIVDLAGKQLRALTKDGSETIFNGRLDWVYEEELYGRGLTRGYWWSPDSTQIAYLRLDEAPVHNFTVVDHIPRRQRIEDTAYPLAGDPNPLVKLAAVNIVNGATKFIDTSKYAPADFLISRVAWSPDNRRVVYQAQNREQTFLDLNAASSSDGASRNLFREQTRAWVEVVDNPVWLKDGSFLWRSERTGWMHIYHFSPEGKLICQLTNGDWEARSLDGVDETNGFVYFTGTKDSHIAEQAYRVKLDGTGLTRLTKINGAHRIAFNSSNTLFVDYRSDISTPTQVRLYKADGTLARAIDENNVVALKDYKLGTPEFLHVKTRDGFEMEALMIRPPDFDPNKKYPVMSYTYSGPHAPQVKNSWGGATYMWHQLLAQKGYIIWICDNRTASGKGAQSAWPVYKNFGELELRDLEDGITYLKSQPYIDASRIGLWGWSFGGFMTNYALTHSDSFRIGIAGGSVTDWLNYDSVYTERYMQTPEHNPEGYKTTAPTASAKNLRGKLLLIHGAIDDNVHLQNTVQMIYALQKADKQFQFMLYPKSRHGVTDPLLVKHMREMMTDFITANL
ncbi:MAG: DPP IV N-terminal domain-containing protein [Pyrinomonadaceae bacterium]